MHNQCVDRVTIARLFFPSRILLIGHVLCARCCVSCLDFREPCFHPCKIPPSAMAKTSALASQPGGKSTAKQPNDYIQTVRHHAARDIRTSLYPGVNYGHLTRFLQQHSSHHSSHSPSSRLNYAVIHDLSHSHGEHGRVIAFDADSGRDDFANHPYPEVGSGHLVFLHGYPSPEWMGVVGARYRVDPEFFHRLLIHTQSGDFYDTPALPSASTNIITLPFCSLGQYLGGFIRATEGDETLDTHFRSLGVRFRTGESIVRAFHLHDEQHFSLVQNISLCVIPRKSSGWSGTHLLRSQITFALKETNMRISSNCLSRRGSPSRHRAPRSVVQAHDVQSRRCLLSSHPI